MTSGGASFDASEALLWDGRYRLTQPLSFGREADVAEAIDLLRGGGVVLKRLRAEAFGAWPDFLREYRIHRQLSHPAIPRALELGFTREGERLCPYFVMERAPGRSLEELLRAGDVAAIDPVALAVDLLRALDHVHRQGFLHGDVSPSNLVVSGVAPFQTLRLLDFGLALPRNRAIGDELWRRPHFAAPELLAGAIVDARTDLYAVGRTLATIRDALHVRAGLEAFEALIARCLEPTPAHRPATASVALGIVAPSGPVETAEAFTARLLAVPLPWRERLETFARELCTGVEATNVIEVDVPDGLPLGRLLGAAMDEAASRRARVLPILNASNPEAMDAFMAVIDDLDASPASDAGEALTPVQTASVEVERLLFVVIEDIGSLPVHRRHWIAQRLGSRGRILAIRQGAPEGDGPRRGSHQVLPRWGSDEAITWLRRALGRITAPWEQSASLPPVSPLGLIEALGEAFRAGHLIRSGEGYLWRGSPRDVGEWSVHVPTLEERLACVMWPLPRGALIELAGARRDELMERFERVGRGAFGLHGDDVEPLDGANARPWPDRADDETTGQVVRGSAARLARALERHGGEMSAIARAWLDAGACEQALPWIVAASDDAPIALAFGVIAHARQAFVSLCGRTELEGALLLASGRLALRSGEVEDCALSIEALAARPDHSAELMRLRFDFALARERWAEAAALAQDDLRRSAGPHAIARIHLARALAFLTEGLPGAALAERDALGPFLRGVSATTERSSVLKIPSDLMGIETDLLELSTAGGARPASGAPAEGASGGLVSAGDRTSASVASRAARGRETHRTFLEALNSARHARMTGRIDHALVRLAPVLAHGAPRDAGEALLVRLEAGACAFEVGDLEGALETAQEASRQAYRSSAWPSRRVEACTLEAQLVARLVSPQAALNGLGQIVGVAPTHPAALDQRLLELELQLMTRDSRAATGLASAAVRLGQDLARRLHHRRAARAFRIATEAAMRAPEIGPPSELARLAAHALEGIDPAFIGRSFHLLTAARALSHDLRLAEAEVRHAAVRDALLVAALRIVDPEVRERWLAHPDQRALAAVSGADPAGGSPVFLPLRA